MHAGLSLVYLHALVQYILSTTLKVQETRPL